MGAERHSRRCRSSGQSLIEFVIMLPVFVVMLFLLLRVDSAIQVSIVNQKYSRQRIFELIANHAHYPDMGRPNPGRPGGARDNDRRAAFIAQGDNRMVIGVSEDSTQVSGTVEPIAPTQLITRSKTASAGASDEAKNENIKKRAKVRVRNTVEICTPILAAKKNGGEKVALVNGLGEDTFKQVTFCTGGIDE